LRSAFERELLEVVSVFEVVELVSFDEPELFIDEPLLPVSVPLAPMLLEPPLAPMVFVLLLSFMLLPWLLPAPVFVELPDGLALLFFAAPFELEAEVPVPEVPDVPCAMAYPPMASAAAAARVVSVCLVVIIETPSVETYRDGTLEEAGGMPAASEITVASQRSHVSLSRPNL
jgi:hypothetical protein